ncbi:hypothetical protein Hanom_Chr11g01032621 [Helianthus anomalus]
MESRPVEEGSGIPLSKGDMGKGGSNIDRSAEGAFNDVDEGSTSKDVRDNSRNIFFFESKKRTRRYRKKGGRAQSNEPLNSHGEFLDSSENSRPNKRNRAQSSHYVEDVFINRAQEAVNNDLFSLNRLLDQVIKDKVNDGGGTVQRDAPSNSGSSPTPLSSEFRFDLNEKAGSSNSGGDAQLESADARSEGAGVLADKDTIGHAT